MNIREVKWLRRLAFLWRNWENKRSFRHGKNNKTFCDGLKVASRIQITGNGNKVILEEGALLLNTLIKINGNNNLVILKAKSYVSGAELWVENDNCELSIGERTFVGHHSHLACTEDGSKLEVGCDGMISSYVQVRTGDSHSILDMEGHRINPAASITIGKHVWLCEGSKVLKGVTLGDNIVVSTGAIVTKSFDNNVLLGGIPAKIIKENITWDSRRL